MIKKIFINLLIIIIIVSLKYSGFISYLEIKGVFPDFFLILTVLNGFFVDPSFAMIFGFLSGLTKDILWYPLIGLYALIYAVIGYLTSISKIIYIENALTSSLVILIFIIIKCFLFLSLGFIFLELEQITQYFKNVFWIEIIYTMLISIPVFLIYKKIYSRSRKSRRDV